MMLNLKNLKLKIKRVNKFKQLKRHLHRRNLNKRKKSLVISLRPRNKQLKNLSKKRKRVKNLLKRKKSRRNPLKNLLKSNRKRKRTLQYNNNIKKLKNSKKNCSHREVKLV